MVWSAAAGQKNERWEVQRHLVLFSFDLTHALQLLLSNEYLFIFFTAFLH